jgi:Zn ribbon nucleic-acid-binding protein
MEGTLYQCPECETRYLAEQWCPDCSQPCRRLGTGGSCPSCQELITITELTDGSVSAS